MGMGFFVAACNRDNAGEDANESGVTGSITVTIKNQNENSNASRATGTPSATGESIVNSFGVYVFDAVSGNIEKSEIILSSLSGTVSGLSTSTHKNVVVLVNCADYSEFTPVTTYNAFLTDSIALSTQDPATIATTGLFMSGQATDVDLTQYAGTELVIGVSRAVARVELASITVSPDDVSDLDEFEFVGVTMQKVASKVLLTGDMPVLTDADYVGGLDGEVSQTGVDYSTLLYTAYAPASITADEPVEPAIYFYVFPNDGQTYPTLMTIDAKYMNETAYYTFAINDHDLRTASGITTDPNGTFIKKNTIYKLHITLTGLANYVRDPDNNDLVDVDIRVSVTDWDDTIIQNVVW